MLLQTCELLGTKCRLSCLTVYVVGDARMKAEHLRHFGDATSTDCMTFPMDVDAKGRATEGELLLCWPHARRLAKLHGIDARSELLLYGVHGLLHLCGFEDKTAAGFRTMHALEDKLLMRLGVGAIFAAGTNRKGGSPS